MEKLFLLPLLVLLITCDAVDSDLDPDAVYIRVVNSSPVDFSSVYLSFPGDKYTFDTLESGRNSHYQKFEEAYRYGYIEVKTHSETYVLQPIDYVGESPLSSGKYTFKLDLWNQSVTLETSVD